MSEEGAATSRAGHWWHANGATLSDMPKNPDGCGVTACKESGKPTRIDGAAGEFTLCPEHARGGHFGRGRAWEEYEILEEDLLQILKVMPLETSTKAWWSPRLADLLRRTGSAVDSFLREWGRFPNIGIGKGQTNIKVYFEYFTPRIPEILGTTVYVRSWDHEVHPWGGWTAEQGPPWWSAYNQVKHDAWGRRSKATMEHVVGALAALLVLHATNPFSRQYICPEAARRITRDANGIPIAELWYHPVNVRTPLDRHHYLFEIRGIGNVSPPVPSASV